MTLHYTAGPINDISAVGFNLADVSSLSQLNALPEGMKGLVWIGTNPGATSTFVAQVSPFVGNPKLFGFRLGDEPDPLGRYGHAQVTPAQYKAETDWIRLNGRGAKSFVVLMDLGSYEAPSLAGAYTPANSGFDFVGLDPYPIRGLAQDIGYIDRMVNAAKAVGWTVDHIIPVHQAFGGGTYTTTTRGQTDRYVLPTPAQAEAMFKRWAELIPNPVFDMAWTYETKSGISSIASTTPEGLALRATFKTHNTFVPPVPVPSKYAEIAKTFRVLADQFEALDEVEQTV
jgi:hypothetical protein